MVNHTKCAPKPKADINNPALWIEYESRAICKCVCVAGVKWIATAWIVYHLKAKTTISSMPVHHCTHFCRLSFHMPRPHHYYLSNSCHRPQHHCQQNLPSRFVHIVFSFSISVAKTQPPTNAHTDSLLPTPNNKCVHLNTIFYHLYVALPSSLSLCYVSAFSVQRNLYEENSQMCCMTATYANTNTFATTIIDAAAATIVAICQRRHRCRCHQCTQMYFFFPQTPWCRVVLGCLNERKRSPNMTSMNYLYARYSYVQFFPCFALHHRIQSHIHIHMNWEPMECERCKIAPNVTRWQQSTHAPNSLLFYFTVWLSL